MCSLRYVVCRWLLVVGLCGFYVDTHFILECEGS